MNYMLCHHIQKVLWILRATTPLTRRLVELIKHLSEEDTNHRQRHTSSNRRRRSPLMTTYDLSHSELEVEADVLTNI